MEVKCNNCGKQVTIREEKLQRNKGKAYCSRKCFFEGTTKYHLIKCVVCGKEKQYTSREYGKRKGLYCSRACYGKANMGEKHGYWKGGIHEKPDSGYIMQYAGKGKYERQHRMVVEKHLGHVLKKNEVVHHINRDRKDNRIENLKVMTSGEHTSFHMKEYYKKKRESK